MPLAAWIAHELIRPRRSRVLSTLLSVVAVVVVAWGLIVCVTITLAVLAAIFGF